MATAYGPSIIRDGLVLCLDAANPKSLLTSVEVLVVAGGGGGGHGGGGAGGLIYNSAFSVNPGTALTVTVGGGGAGGISGSRGATPAGTNGGNSVFGSLTSIGGGGGSAAGAANAGNGGSGGGQGGDNNAATRTSGTAGQGFGGGRSSRASYGAAGGGGGAGGAGSDATDQSSTIGQGGNGGVGLQYSISGSNVFYAGGGGGGANLNIPDTTASGGGVGGTGGGGSGGLITDSGFRAATTPNTGGGGGGAEYEGALAGGGAGGSGIVIVRYQGPQKATGGTITSVGGYTIHSFTTVGSTTFTPNATWSDLSGGNNNATLVNNPTYTPSERGYLTFLGTQTASFSAPALSSNTLEFVFYNTSGTDTYPTLYNQVGQNGASGFHWVYGFSSSETINVQYANGTSPVSMSYSSALPLNTYVHISIVSDLSAQTITCYRNGVSLGTTSTPGIKPIAASTGYIGTYQNDTSSSSYRLKGRVPYFKIYNIALTAAQVAQNFNALRGRYGI